jgi:hypothetical protein
MKKIIPILLLSLALFCDNSFAGQVNNPYTGKPDIIPTIAEEDGSPSIQVCRTLKFANGSVTDNGDSTCSIAGGGGGGTGDVESAGDCLSGACYDGTSDGGTYVRLYDGDSNYGALVTSNLTGNRTYTFPNFDGTMATLAGTETLTNKTLAAANNVIDADTAVALAANGSNCSAGSYPLGVDASGASESCTALPSTAGGICFHFGDGTNVITTGEKKSARREVKRGGTITGWTILSLDDTSGAITVDVWMDSYANYPPTVADTMVNAGTKPSIAASGTKNTSTTLTSWDTAFSAGDVFSVNVDSVTSFKDVEICLDVTFN